MTITTHKDGVWNLEEFYAKINAGYVTGILGNELWIWGDGDAGALGQNNTTDYSSPVQIPGTTWSLVANAYHGAYGLKTDGTLWAWGCNQSGQLGQNDLVHRSSPIQIPGTNWCHAGAGYFSHVFLKTDGTLWTLGNSGQGQAGNDSTASNSSPVQVPGITWNYAISGGFNTPIHATKTDGTLWGWGINNVGGELGVGDSLNKSSPTQIPGITWTTNLWRRWGSTGGNVGGGMAIKTDGTLWTWGGGRDGVMGNNNTINYSSPIQVPGTTWSAVCGQGVFFSAGLKTDGTLWAWGRSNEGQLGQNNVTARSSPVQIPGTTWCSIAGISNGILALKTDGNVWTWGANKSGMLGDNTSTHRSSPVQLPGTTWIKQNSGSSECINSLMKRPPY